jgi:phosphotransferase system HPr (HPr) family protein
MAADTLRRTVIIRNPQGFHMRPAAALVEAARRFQSQAVVIHGDRRSSAREVLDLMMLLAEPGAEVTLEVQGPDAEQAIEVLAQVLGAEEPPATLPKKG